MCELFSVNRQSFYNYKKPTVETKHVLRRENLTTLTIAIFNEGKKVYGAKKIVRVLRKKHKINTSNRLISLIMKQNFLISTYNKKLYRPYSKGSNKEIIENHLQRQFQKHTLHSTLTSDLTYVKVNGINNYVCLILDLFNREVVGYSVGKFKTPELVIKAIDSIQFNLDETTMFHTDRGLEFKNEKIDEILDSHNIIRLLSKPGNPYDNACSESMFHILKEEMIGNKRYTSLEELETDLTDFIQWYNNERVHSTLGYMSPAEFKTSVTVK